jgi:hypothetical protein
MRLGKGVKVHTNSDRATEREMSTNAMPTAQEYRRAPAQRLVGCDGDQPNNAPIFVVANDEANASRSEFGIKSTAHRS